MKNLTLKDLQHKTQRGNRMVRMVSPDNTSEFVILSFVDDKGTMSYRRFNQLKGRTENTLTKFSENKFYDLTEDEEITVDILLSKIEKELIKKSQKVTLELLEIGALLEKMPKWVRRDKDGKPRHHDR